MPYDFQTKSGVILRNIPDEITPDSPELKRLVYQASTRGMTTEQKRDRLKAENPAEYDPASPEWHAKYGDATSGMNYAEKAAANMGAGMSDLIHGTKQRFAEWTGDEKGAADLRAETLDKRRRDAELADKTAGGAVWNFAGAALPGAVAALVPGGQGIAATALMGAAGGALGGAFQPTAEGESVTRNAVLGGTVGAVLPLALRGAGATYRGVTKGTEKRAAERLSQLMANEGDNAVKPCAPSPTSSTTSRRTPGAPTTPQTCKARKPAGVSRSRPPRNRRTRT
jgi:hypothetical protein